MNNIGFCRFGYKSPRFLVGTEKVMTFPIRDLEMPSPYDREQVLRPSGVIGLALFRYQPKTAFKPSPIVLTHGSIPLAEMEYSLEMGTLKALTTNMVVPEGGEATAINPETRILSHEHSPYLTQVSRVLVLDYALEMLLLLVDEGPMSLDKLVEELVPQNNIIKIISELRRCDLIEIDDNSVSPTPKAVEIAALLRANLKDNPHETSQPR